VGLVSIVAVSNSRLVALQQRLETLEQTTAELADQLAGQARRTADTQTRLETLTAAPAASAGISPDAEDDQQSTTHPQTRPASTQPAASLDPASSRVDAALDVAWQRAVAGDLIGASQALLNVPDDPQALGPAQRVRLGAVLVRLERWQALERVLAALADPPAELAGQVNFLRAVADIHAGELARALATLDALLLEQPTDYDLLLWRAIVLIVGGKPTQARHSLATAQSVAPQRPEAAYWLAVAAWHAGRAEEAAAALDELLESHPGYGPALLTRGRLALEHGDLAQAEESLKAAIGAMPWHGEGHLWLAAVYARLGQIDHAKAELRQALRLDPHLARPAARDAALGELLGEIEADTP